MINKIRLDKLILKCWQSLSQKDLNELNKEQRLKKLKKGRDE